MKKYLTQRTFNIVGAAAIVWCAISIGTKPNVLYQVKVTNSKKV